MRAIIPVAGIGKRLRPHTFTTPKVLLNVAGKPILGHILDSLVEIGVDKSTIVTGYMGDRVIEYVKKRYPNLDVTFVHQEEALGLGHAIWTARETFNDEPLIIILGDTIFDVNLNFIFGANSNAIGVKYVDDPRRFGVVITDKNNNITKFVEKPQEPISKMAIVGIYYIKNSKLLSKSLNHILENDIKTREEYQLTDALQLMLDNGEQFTTFQVDGWYDCGKPETLLQTNRFLLDKFSTKSEVTGSVVISPSYVSPKATLENSVIGPYASIADEAIVKDSIVKNSIISFGANVSNSLLDESIIGNEAYVNGLFQKLNVGDSSSIDYSHES